MDDSKVLKQKLSILSRFREHEHFPCMSAFQGFRIFRQSAWNSFIFQQTQCAPFENCPVKGLSHLNSRVYSLEEHIIVRKATEMEEWYPVKTPNEEYLWRYSIFRKVFEWEGPVRCIWFYTIIHPVTCFSVQQLGSQPLPNNQGESPGNEVVSTSGKPFHFAPVRLSPTQVLLAIHLVNRKEFENQSHSLLHTREIFTAIQFPSSN